MEHEPPLLTGLTFHEIASLLGSEARAKALLRWLWSDGLPATMPERVSGVAQGVWQRVRAECRVPAWRLLSEKRAPDGTVKLALDIAGRKVETVLIPGPRRSTVCLSSQSGCTRRCAFCATARLGFRGNLSAGEIVAQFVLARRLAPAGRPARNAVFMGMGEPMDNLEAVLRAVEILVRSPYPGLSPAHVTVSTSGIVPGMDRFLRESDACLAVSLNASTDEVRRKLMPHTRMWPLEHVLETIRRHPSRQVFIEYLLVAGINDTREDAERLARLLQGLRVTVNLIPFNRFPGGDFSAPPAGCVRQFQKLLSDSGLLCMIRRARGEEIAAACGQLAMNV